VIQAGTSKKGGVDNTYKYSREDNIHM
jgi:hypothetical protein